MSRIISILLVSYHVSKKSTSDNSREFLLDTAETLTLQL